MTVNKDHAQYGNCNCKVSKIYDFDIGIKKSEGLLELFFVCKRFFTVNTNRIHLPKIFKFFFHMVFGGSGKPSFGWYKVNSRSYLCATTTIRLLGAPKFRTELLFVLTTLTG